MTVDIIGTVCIRCPFAKCRGECICHAVESEPVPVVIRLERGECPKNYFNEPHKLPRAKSFIDNLDEDEKSIIAEIDTSPEGIGDTLTTLLEKFGADRAAKLYEKITGESCGCEARRAWLNKFWPYNK